MKKRLLSLGLVVVIVFSFCMVAVASDHVVVNQNATEAVFNQDSAGNQEEHLTVKYTAPQGEEQYLVTVLKRDLDDDGNLVNGADATINEIDPDDILYINQIKSAADGTLVFADEDKIYPKSISDSAIYITGKGLDGAMLLATIKAGFMLGDVNDDGEPNTFDAMLIARNEIGIDISPNTFIEEAGDVSGDGSTDTYDAMLIARYEIGIIDKFPVE